jgi:hypothetical protein
MKTETMTTLIFTAVGIAVGYLSWAIANNWAALGLALVVLVALPQVLGRALRVQEKFRWWLANGGWIYLFVWFISWVIFHTLLTPL